MPDFSLRYIIDADGKKAKSELQSVETQIAKLGGSLAKTSNLSASQLNAIAIGAGAVTSGIIALGAAAIEAGKFIFDLSKQTAEFGSAIFDASEKTGLHAESLSAMKLAADQSSSSMDDVTSAIAKFSKTVGAANDGSKEAAANLEALGIDPQEALNDLDGALSKVFDRIAKAKPGIEQITLAQKAFGKSGADLLPFIKSFDGDLAGLVKRAKELGVTIDDEAARAADEFGDQLDTLNAQFAGLARIIGQHFLPALTDAMSKMSRWISDNQTDLSRFANNSEILIKGVVGYWSDLTAAIGKYTAAVEKLAGLKFDPKSFGTSGFYDPSNNPFVKSGAKSVSLRGTGGGGALGVANPSSGGLAKATDPSGGDDAAEQAEKRAKEREAAFKKELSAQSKQYSLLLQGERDGFASSNKAWEEAFLKGEIDKEKFRENALKNIVAYGHRAQDLLDKQRAIESKGASGTDLENIRLEHQNASAALYNDLQRERADVEASIQKTEEKTAEIKDADRKKSLAGWQAARDIQKQVYDITVDQIDLQEKEREDQRKFWQDDLDHLQKANQRPVNLAHRSNSPTGLAAAGGSLLDAIGMGDEVVGQAKSRTDAIGETFSKMGAMVGDAVGNMAQGIGSMVEQWVLYGDAGPDALKKMTAAVLANLAAQASVEAIMELARGFAALARYDFPSATNHFTSAAVFGGLAAGAALAGRAIAGDSFSKGGSSGGSRSPNQLSGQDRDRDLTPISRSNGTTYDSGSQPLHATMAQIGHHLAASQAHDRAVAEALNKFTQKFEASRPGDVLVRGANEKPGFIGAAYNKDASNNSSIAQRTRRIFGDR